MVVSEGMFLPRYPAGRRRTRAGKPEFRRRPVGPCRLLLPPASDSLNTTHTSAHVAPRRGVRMAKLEVPCPGCKTVLKAPAEAAGRKAQCKKCGATFRIPKPHEAPQAA